MAVRGFEDDLDRWDGCSTALHIKKDPSKPSSSPPLSARNETLPFLLHQRSRGAEKGHIYRPAGTRLDPPLTTDQVHNPLLPPCRRRFGQPASIRCALLCLGYHSCQCDNHHQRSSCPDYPAASKRVERSRPKLHFSPLGGCHLHRSNE